mgnify:CR=1 FL=1
MNNSCSSFSLEDFRKLTDYQIQILKMPKTKKDLFNIDIPRTKFMVLKQKRDYMSITEKMLMALLSSCKGSNLEELRVDGSKNPDSLSSIEKFTEYSMMISNLEIRQKNATLLLNNEELNYYSEILQQEMPEYKFIESYNITRTEFDKIANSTIYKVALIYDVVVQNNDEFNEELEREYQLYLEMIKLSDKYDKKKQKGESK